MALTITHRYGHDFPYATFLVNLTGSFLIGAIAQYTMRHPGDLGAFMRVFLIVGLLGGYTTFSSFSFENLGLVGEGRIGLATLYAAGSVLTGIGAAYSGSWLVRLLP